MSNVSNLIERLSDLANGLSEASEFEGARRASDALSGLARELSDKEVELDLDTNYDGLRHELGTLRDRANSLRDRAPYMTDMRSAIEQAVDNLDDALSEIDTLETQQAAVKGLIDTFGL